LFRQNVGTQSLQAAPNDYSVYDNVRVKVYMPRRDDPVPTPLESFADLTAPPHNIHESIMSNIERANYSQPTPIQKYAIPIAFQQLDVMACSQTGSGKTLAYVLPILQRILSNDWKRITGTPSTHQDHDYARQTSGPALPFALVLAPTRELAQQIGRSIWMLSNRTGVLTRICYGGDSAFLQKQALHMGADILVGTPGRVQDFMDQGVLSFAELRILVLDECDRMLDMGFEPQIRGIYKSLPDTSRPDPETGLTSRQTLLFSATFPPKIRDLAREFLNDPRCVHIAVGQIGDCSKNITQKLYDTPGLSEKFDLLKDILLGRHEPTNELMAEIERSTANPTASAAMSEMQPSTGSAADLAGEQSLSGSDSSGAPSRVESMPNLANMDTIDALGSRPTSQSLGDSYSPYPSEDRRGLSEHALASRYQIIIFANKKHFIDELADRMRDYNINPAVIHGDLSQGERNANLKRFKSGRCNVLVATDVAQRGLDIPNVRIVINFDLPLSAEDYTHRIGRTGRGTLKGLAISFVNEREDTLGTLKDLRTKLADADQEIPEWFLDIVDERTSARRPRSRPGYRRHGY